ADHVQELRERRRHSGTSPATHTTWSRGDHAEQIVRTVLVKLQHVGDCLQHLRRWIAITALLEPEVVVRTHPGKQGDLLAAKARDPAYSCGRQADLFGTHKLTSGPKVDAQPVVVAHDSHGSGEHACRRASGWPPHPQALR